VFFTQYYFPDWMTIVLDAAILIIITVTLLIYKYHPMLGYIYIALFGSQTFYFYANRVTYGLTRMNYLIMIKEKGEVKAYVIFGAMCAVNLVITTLSLWYTLKRHKKDLDAVEKKRSIKVHQPSEQSKGKSLRTSHLGRSL
jgi:predicted membrane protein